jgi:Ca2+-binding RTX toxin-like protein
MASSHRRALVRALLIGALVTGISGVSAGTAFATASSTSVNGVVTVTTDGGVTITCASGSGALLVNAADVGSGRTYCGTTTMIHVIGDPAVNTIDLSGVLAADFASGASTQVEGFDGADVITGSELPDRISGDIGADVINGGDGKDTIAGGIGADALNGGNGTDTLSESADVDFTLTDTTLTGLGADTLASFERVRLTGGVSANTIDASTFNGPTVLSGGSGDDVLTGGTNDDVLKGALGADAIHGGAGTDTLLEHANVNFTLTDGSLTGLGADTLTSVERANLAGGTGANTIDASAFTGTTVLSGKRGNDVLIGGANDDLLRGSSGADSLTGVGGSDVLRAGAGDDSLDSLDGVGNDVDHGDRGLDSCTSDPRDAVRSCER